MTNFIDITNPFRTTPVLSDRASVQHQVEDLFRLEDDSATELILVRHAEPAHKLNEGACDNHDPLLSCCGLAQAERLAERLGPIWLEAIYSSPERRAQQTARILAEPSGRDVHCVPNLREIDFTPQYGDDREASIAERFIETPRWDALPGFASSKAFRRRSLQAIESLIAAHQGRRIVVVIHASVINAYLSAVLAIPRDVFFAPEYASLTCVHSLADLYAVRSLNDVSHLAGHIGRTA